MLITEIIIIMTNLKIKEIIGTSNAILRSSGISLYDIILSEIKGDNKIIIDFSEIENLTSGFCNASFGKLAMEIENIKDFIILQNISNNIFEDKINNSLKHSQLKDSTSNFKSTDNAILDLFN